MYLRCLEIDGFKGLDLYFPGQSFDAFLRAACKLERLFVGSICTQEHLNAFIQNIRWMKTQELGFRIKETEIGPVRLLELLDA